MRAVSAPLPGLGLPALSRPAPVVVFFSRIDTGGLAARAWKGAAGRVLDQDSGAGGPLSRLGMCGGGRGHCGGALGGPLEASSLGWESFC